MINLSKNIQYYLFIFINLDSIDISKFNKIIKSVVIFIDTYFGLKNNLD